MANTHPYQYPTLWTGGAGSQSSPRVVSLPTSGTFNQFDVLLVNGSGQLVQGASNSHANIAGIACYGSGQNYSNAGAYTYATSLFGPGFVGTLMSNDPSNGEVWAANGSQYFVFSVKQARNQNLVNTGFGLLLDSSSTYFVADNTQGNNAMTLAFWIDGPAPDGTIYGSGDTGALAAFTFLSTVVAPI